MHHDQNPGTYTFDTQNDDDVVLFFNNVGTALVPIHFATARPIRSTSPPPGTYPIEVAYQQGGGGAGLAVEYSGPDTGEPVGKHSQLRSHLPAPVPNATQTYANNVSVTTIPPRASASRARWPRPWAI